MKVARVNFKDGPAVCKVFLPYDPSFSVEPYTKQVYFLKWSLDLVDFKKIDYSVPLVAIFLSFIYYFVLTL